MVTFSPAGILTLPAMPSPLRHRVQGGARLEPADLLLGHAVGHAYGDGLARGLLDHHVHRLAWAERAEAADSHAVLRLEEVVVAGIAEHERQDALFLQIALVDSREALRDDGLAPEIPRRHGGMLAAGSLAVVLVADDHPADAPALEISRDLREGLVDLPRDRVHALASLAGK